MKKALLGIVILTLLVAPAEAIILSQIHYDPWRLAAFLECLSLTLGAFVALMDCRLVRLLRQQAMESAGKAVALPFLLIIPYLILALGTDSFSLFGAGKLAAYIGVPTLLLLPDRLQRAHHAGWRDFVAMLALALPVGAGWLGGIWMWPHEVYSIRPLVCACVAAYAFLVIRGLEDVGYRFIFRKGDLTNGLANFLAFALLGIPLAYILHFIRFHPSSDTLAIGVFQFFGIYLTVAIPEELLFRGILQNILVKSLTTPKRDQHGLVIASVIFGIAHLHHPPVPNWRYAMLATLAGLFYGSAYRSKHHLAASALAHALVDTVWHLWL